MSRWTRFFNRVCKQDTLYWGTPTSDGYENVYSQPKLIKCRWENKSELVSDDKGNMVVCKAQVLVMEDLDVGGVLYLGDFLGVDNDHRVDPLTLDNAFIIRKVEKIPMFGSTTDFVRKVWLG